jgi:GNAT superfamily N-acetyltransferase
MSAGKLRIDTILAKDLYDFYSNFMEHAAGQQICPISRARAMSQSNNPCADPEDVGLFVAYLDDQCVGYQGVLPGRLRTEDGLAKVYWCTASYVVPEARKRMVGVQLIRKLISLRQDLIVTYFNKVFADVYKGLHFQEIEGLDYVTVRPDRLDFVAYPFTRFYRLQKRLPALKKFAEGMIAASHRSFYPAVRRFYYTGLARRAEAELKAVRWTETPDARVPTGEPFNGGELRSFERNADVINWTIAYPWIQSGGAKSSPSYYFGESYEMFRYYVLTLNDANGTASGFVVLSVATESGEMKLKVLDFRAAGEDYGKLFWLVCKYAARFKADEIELPAEMSEYAARMPFGSIVMKRENRRYLCYPSAKDSPLAKALPSLKLDLADGDCPFT